MDEHVARTSPGPLEFVAVIFGGSGDLTRRKLVPALFRLACGAGNDIRFHVVGVAVDDLTDESFRAHLYGGVREAFKDEDIPHDAWIAFARNISYVRGDLGSFDAYRALAERLGTIHAETGIASHLFYCSTPPSLAPAIVGGLKAVGLESEENGWSRIIIEKPFGSDLESARALNACVAEAFEEHQIYRIDHYLGKETVQNLLVFRFGNTMYEPVWNRNYIEFVEITAAEPLGVGNRVGYYDRAGALRDMVANHLLQLLTLTAMEPPIAFDADSVREQKVQVLRSIRPLRPDEVLDRTVRGQYTSGYILGEEVPGYLDEPGVPDGSTTETYAAIEFAIQNWRWSGVPFYVRTGKRLARQLTEINMHFKRTPHALFANVAEGALFPNVITIRIQPDEAVRVTFGAKQPGTTMRTAMVQMDFSYETGFGVQTATAYETLLLDAIEGDATLFTRRDEVENEWKLMTPILETWRDAPASSVRPYAAGSAGPDEAEAMLARNGHGWRPLVPKPKRAVHAKTGLLNWPGTRILKPPAGG